MWLNQSQDSLCFIELSVVVDTPFNERLCALFRSLSGVPEHSSHTCCSRHTYPDLIIMFYLHGCQTITKSSFYLWVEHFNFYVFRLNVYRLNVFFEGAINTILISIPKLKRNMHAVVLILLDFWKTYGKTMVALKIDIF